jgi:hypothetical protein
MVPGDRKTATVWQRMMRGIIDHDHSEPKALEDWHMKRTRRIEITSYRRRVTVSHGEPSAAEVLEGRPERDLILNVLQSIPPMSEEVDSNVVVLKGVDSEHLPRRRSLLRLARLLRPRKKT